MTTQKIYAAGLAAGLLAAGLLGLSGAVFAQGAASKTAPGEGAASKTAPSDGGADKTAPAEPDVLIPDRPGFTNGSDTVVPGRVQVESGFARTKGSADSGGGQATDGPQTLVRAGLNPKLELRVILPDYIWPSGGQSGFGDGGVGVRYKFYQSKNGNTKVSLTPILSIPVRSAVTTSGHFDPILSLNGQTTSGSRWSLSSNVILAFPTITGRRVTDFTVTGQVNYQVTSPLSLFADIYDDLPRGGPPSSIGDGGLTYRLTSNLQLDLETGRGLGGAAPVQFYGGGVSVRF